MKIKFKKSQILLIGSLLVFVGVLIIFYGHFKTLKEEVYEDIRLSLINTNSDTADKNTDSDDTSSLGRGEINYVSDATNVSNISRDSLINATYDSYKYNYIGTLEIPKIRLKRGFLSKDDKYNNISRNITVSYDANYPDVNNGNFILVAHSGDAYISFFAYLYKLKIGDKAYVTYNGSKYTYSLVKIEEQPKNGVVAIHRPSYDTKSLTLITCTKDNDSAQTIYIFNIV